MPCLEIYVPAELEDISEDLARFFDSMVYKLRKNAHKGRWQDLKLVDAMRMLRDEVEELHVATMERSRVEIQMEAADAANFALIVCAIALEGKRNV